MSDERDRPSGITIADLGLTTSSLEQSGEHTSRAFFQAWFQLFKTAQIHAAGNQALRRPIERFATIAGRIIAAEGSLSLQAKDRTLFVNSMKLHLTTEEYALAGDVFDFFDQRGMGGFSIDGPLRPDAVRRALEILVYASAAERSFERLRARLRQADLPLQINRPLGTARAEGGGGRLERRAYVFYTYSKLVVLYRALLGEDGGNPIKRRYLVRKIVRTVQALVDICLAEDHTLLGLATVKQAEDYPAHHAANTAVLAIVLGEKLGLAKVDLADLGLAGLFHDIGMRRVPARLLSQRGPLQARERRLVEEHPLHGVEFLLREPHFTRSVLRRIVVAFEHHRGPETGGYPQLLPPPHLFSRIVSIAAGYDALTTARPWRRAYLPDEALGVMLARPEQFDPRLVKVFVNALGLYPVGTLVRLSSGELAVVLYGGSEGDRASRPVVGLLGSDGRALRSVDLSEVDENGTPRRSIVAAEDPAKYGLRASALLVPPATS
jgi:hypothetical protein